MQNNISPITKTIMESRDEFRKLWPGLWTSNQLLGVGQCNGQVESHLFQSQIKVIEAVIESLEKSKRENCKLSIGSAGKMEHCGAEHNQALEDQISSLNETLEELKKSL